MEIKPQEVDHIKVIGQLNGDDVKVIKTIGGWYCAVGRKSKNKKTVEPLAAGSHLALVAHQIEKQFSNDFQHAMFKSESEVLPVVKEFTKKLPVEMVDAGYELFTMTKNEKVNFVATKLGAEVISFEATATANGYEIQKGMSIPDKSRSYKEAMKICQAITEIINEGK